MVTANLSENNDPRGLFVDSDRSFNEIGYTEEVGTKLQLAVFGTSKPQGDLVMGTQL